MENAAEDEKKRLEEARLAMEGAEHTAKREAEQKLLQAAAEKAEIEKRLKEINAEKEKLELAWVEIDDRRKQIRTAIDPLLAEEAAEEKAEAEAETEEAKIGLAKDKQIAEKKRWELQQKRHGTEEKKWVEEEKIAKLEEEISKHTAVYRKWLDEEDKLNARLAELNQLK
jgi:hypothetical protein